MTPDLTNYIETQLLPTVGIVEENTQPITTLTGMVNWIQSNLRVRLPITERALTDYLMLDNDGIISKKRNIYLNQLDFYCLDLPVLGDDTTLPWKDILSVLIVPVTEVNAGEFYYCTDDEWEIWKAGNL